MTARDNAVAALDVAIEASRVEGAQSRDGEVATLAQQLSDANSAIGDYVAEVAEHKAAYAELEAEYAAYVREHPGDAEPPRPALLLGASFPGPADEAFYDGRVDVARLYVPPGLTDVRKWDDFMRAYDDEGVREFVLSWKDDSTSSVGPMLHSIPDDVSRTYGIVNHEPENDGTTMTPARWQAKQAAHLPIVRAEGGVPAFCLMQWTLDPASGRRPADWVPAAGLADVPLFDYYPTSASGQDKAIARIKAFGAQFGFARWGIGEYAVPQSASWGPAAIKAFKPMLAGDGGAEVACYWPSQKKGGVNYHFVQATADAWLATA